MLQFGLLCILFTILIVISRRITKSFFTVPSIFCEYWFLYFFLTYIFTFKEYDWSFLSMWFIFALSVVLLIGYYIGHSFELKKTKLTFDLSFINKRIIVVCLIIGACIAMIYPIMILRHYNGSILDLFNLKKIIEINELATADRYENGFQFSSITSLFLLFVYAMPLVGGYYFSIFKWKGKLLTLAMIVPPCFVVLLVNTKAVIIGSVLLFVTGLITYRCSIHKKENIKIKYVLICGILGFIFIGGLVASMMIRVGRIDLNTFYYVINKFVSYAFGSLPAFDNWLANNFLGSLGYGENTFLGLFDLLGLAYK